MFKTNIKLLPEKFENYNLVLKKEIYCWSVSSDIDLDNVRTFLKNNSVVNILLGKEFNIYLKELYLLGAALVYPGTNLDTFLDKALISSGLLLTPDLGSMPFDQKIDAFVLHPVTKVESNRIHAQKQCNIESVYLNHSFWSDKVIDQIKEEENVISIDFHENVQKIGSKKIEDTVLISSDNIISYSSFVKNNINQINSDNITNESNLASFWNLILTNKYDIILYESSNDSKILNYLLFVKIQKIQPNAKIAFISSLDVKTDCEIVSKNVQNINKWIVSNSKHLHYSLNTFSSYLYSRESFKACRLKKDHIIISTDNFFNPEAILLLTVSNSLVKVYKNKIIGSKFYYWAHLEHLTEENLKNFTRFLDKKLIL